MAIINGLDSETRELVFMENCEDQFGERVKNTSIGRRFRNEFEQSDENIEIVLKAAATLFPGKALTESRYLKALELSMAAGDLVRKPASPVVEQAPEPEVPRDRNGRPLSQSQIAWGEMTRWANEHSAADCRKRAAQDPAFRSFMQTNLRREMTQEIDGAVVAQDDIRPNAPRVGNDELNRLMKFAQDFNALPTLDAKRKMLPAFNPAWESFNQDFEQCRALRLL